jgi:hypothetical protein
MMARRTREILVLTFALISLFQPSSNGIIFALAFAMFLVVVGF